MVLSIEDPQDVRQALEDAFTPGPELEIGDEAGGLLRTSTRQAMGFVENEHSTDDGGC